jgi:hypothetical protein
MLLLSDMNYFSASWKNDSKMLNIYSVHSHALDGISCVKATLRNVHHSNATMLVNKVMLFIRLPCVIALLLNSLNNRTVNVCD